jgi:co-chaperonin GroES (HSP10)
MAESRVELDYAGIDHAFPVVDPGLLPYGSRILVQIRSPRTVTKGGIIVPDESRDTEFWNTQVAKVIKLGPLAFKNRDTKEEWPEGAWCREGTFVRVPNFGGDKWFVDLPGAESKRVGVDRALFVLFNDLDMIGEVTVDPMEVIAYL